MCLVRLGRRRATDRIGPRLRRDRGVYESGQAATQAALDDAHLAIIDTLLAATSLGTWGPIDVSSTPTLVDPNSGTMHTIQVAASAPPTARSSGC